jgi:hypothetical protein
VREPVQPPDAVQPAARSGYGRSRPSRYSRQVPGSVREPVQVSASVRLPEPGSVRKPVQASASVRLPEPGSVRVMARGQEPVQVSASVLVCQPSAVLQTRRRSRRHPARQQVPGSEQARQASGLGLNRSWRFLSLSWGVVKRLVARTLGPDVSQDFLIDPCAGLLLQEFIRLALQQR